MMQFPLLILLSVLLTFATVSGRWPMEDTLAEYFCNKEHGTNPNLIFCVGFDRLGNPSSYDPTGGRGCLNFRFRDESHRNRLVKNVVPPIIQRPDDYRSTSADPDYKERNELCDVVLVFNSRSFFVLLNTRLHHGGYPVNPVKRSLKMALKSHNQFLINEEISSIDHIHMDFDVEKLSGTWRLKVMYGGTELDNNTLTAMNLTTVGMPSSEDIQIHRWSDAEDDYACQEFDQGCFAQFSVNFKSPFIDFTNPPGAPHWYTYVNYEPGHKAAQFMRIESRAEYKASGGMNAVVDCFSFRSEEYKYGSGSKVDGKAISCINFPVGVSGEGDSKGGSLWWLWLLVVIVILVVLALIAFFLMRRRRRKGSAYRREVSSWGPSVASKAPTSVDNRSVMSYVPASTPTSKAVSGAGKSSVSKKTGKSSKK